MADPDDYLLALLDVPSRLGEDADATLFCVVDTASDPLIYPALTQFAAEERIVPLYQGETAARLAAAAPYLVEPIADGELLAWLFEEMAETSWGILVWSTATLDALRAHFRSLSRVRTEDGTVMLFRLYDPRVLAAFLHSCDAAQLKTVFGPVTVFGVPVIGTDDIRMFTQSADGVLEKEVTLEPLL